MYKRQVFPELVSEDDNEMLAVNYQGLVPVLINALKEQQKEIEILKKQQAEITQLKEVGRYQIAVSKGARTQLYRVDTKTGIIVEVNERALEKVNF